MNPLIKLQVAYNTLHCDQQSRLAIRLNIFSYSANISEANSKRGKSFSLFCRTR